MLSDSVLDTLRTAAAARDRYRREVLGVTIDDVIEWSIWLAAAVAAIGFCLAVFGAI